MAEWIVIADRAEARIGIFEGRPVRITIVDRMSNPLARLQSKEIDSDKAGRSSPSFSGNAYVPEVASDEHAVDKFLKRVIDELAAKHTNGRQTSVVLVAEPTVLGKLRKEVSKHRSLRVMCDLSLDLSRFDDAAALKRLNPLVDDHLKEAYRAQLAAG